MISEFKKDFIELKEKHKIKHEYSLCLNENNWDCNNCELNEDIIDEDCFDCGGSIFDTCTLLEKIYNKFKEDNKDV